MKDFTTRNQRLGKEDNLKLDWLNMILIGIVSILAIVLIVDFIGFVAWVFSGQIPPDDMFIGAITTKIIQLI
jgi:hypothetical protein